MSGQLGWKVGFGSPSALERLGIERPLVAALPQSGLLADGATITVSSWTRPVLEAEVAIWIGRGLGVAIELVDIEYPPDEVDRILAGGIYHRHVVLGPPRTSGLEGANARVLCNGAEVAASDDLTALTGDHESILAAVRAAAGRDLREGEVVIAGAVLPPSPVADGGLWCVDFGALGALSIDLVA